MERDICYFISITIGLCTLEIFREFLFGAVRAVVGSVLVVGYVAGFTVWNLLLLLPQVAVTSFIVFKILENLLSLTRQ